MQNMPMQMSDSHLEIQRSIQGQGQAQQQMQQPLSRDLSGSRNMPLQDLRSRDTRESKEDLFQHQF